MEAHYYNIDINWNTKCKGIMYSPELNKDANTCIEVATPPEFPKGIPGIYSPEHLFTAAVSTCLMTTFLSVAENSKLVFTSFSCKVKGKLEQVEGKFIMSEIVLELIATMKMFSQQNRSFFDKIFLSSKSAEYSLNAKVLLLVFNKI